MQNRAAQYGETRGRDLGLVVSYALVAIVILIALAAASGGPGYGESALLDMVAFP